jgi:hypothetical protein
MLFHFNPLAGMSSQPLPDFPATIHLKKYFPPPAFFAGRPRILFEPLQA